MDELFWLSYPLRVEDPRPPAIPAPSIEGFMSIGKGDDANVQVLKVANHTGTHVDAPAHVIDGGMTIHDFLPSDLVYQRIAVISLKKSDAEIVVPEDLLPFAETLSGAEMALFKFGYGSMRRSDPRRYSLQSPGFGIQAAQWMRNNCPMLRAIGMDVPSFSVIAHIEETMKAHNIILGQTDRKLILIEEMNLEPDLSGLREVRVNPWIVEGLDSSPCTIVGVR
jgi:kynurenine formamidase